ncbi:hypothetical protein EHW66_20245 [Erwinia psidii]|uniref:hypothetical protein n=1 Tax=Erwinia psidii TaxID=69224 RepID=UPI00226B65D9|nr:hypothetical protein [Erwinia psidii]MCX8967218.1 hypothetical protein [Erwinia psidii]
MSKGQHLFNVTATDRIERSKAFYEFISSFRTNMTEVKRMVMTCYRAGRAVTELAITHGDDRLFCVSIREDRLSLTPLLPENVRLTHLDIALPDVADILILVTEIARLYGLMPELSADPRSSSVFTFSAVVS